MHIVKWQRLILRGFGCYQDEIDLELSENSFLSLPNEAGKSTLVAGLAAILYGLPALSDPTKFGQARYRNWHDPPVFNGELYFLAAGKKYHLTRDFTSHHVTMRRQENEQWVQVEHATGTDNPNASRPFRGYRELLDKLLGVNSLDLFLATFCLTQPLPTPASLDASVQGLLAGAGGKASDVQESLENTIRNITRNYGPPLGRARGGNRDRLLEILQTEIADLRMQIDRGQHESDDLQVVQAKLREIAQTIQAKQQLLSKQSSTLRAWHEWRTQAERYRRGLGQQQQVARALSRARELEQEAKVLQADLDTYHMFADDSLDWGGRLEQLVQLGRDLNRLQEEKTSIEQELAEATATREATLAKHNERKQQLATELELVQEHHDTLAEQATAFAEMEANYEARFGDLKMEAAELRDVLAARLSLVEPRRARSEKHPHASLPWLGRLAGSLLGLTSYWLWGKTAGTLGILVALASFLLGWLLPMLVTSKAKPISEKEAKLAALLALDRDDLQAELVYLERLLSAQASSPSPEDLTSARDKLVEAQTELAGWQGVIDAFTKLEDGSLQRRQTGNINQIEELSGQVATVQAPIKELNGQQLPSWQALRTQHAAYLQLKQKMDSNEQAQIALWNAQEVDNLGELEQRALDLQNSQAATRLAWQNLIDINPGLPEMEDVAEARQTRYEELKTEVELLETEIQKLKEDEADLTRRHAQLEGQTPVNIAVATNRLHELQQEKEQLQLEVAALGLAYRELEAARSDYSASYREHLSTQVNDYFTRITGQSERRVELDADFAVSLRGAAGHAISPIQLSQGARDQLYLSLRLAIADLLADDVRLPFILDDPFVNCDQERLERIQQILAELAKERQIWLLTHS